MMNLVMELMGPMALSDAAADSAQMRFGPKTMARFVEFILFIFELSITYGTMLWHFLSNSLKFISKYKKVGVLLIYG